jgi:hypothetical protein
MKIFKKILILTSLILVSCSEDNNEYDSYDFVENSTLNIEMYDESYMKYGNIEEGTNLVFEYEYSAEEKESISDDEYSEFIRFEINPELTEFNYKNEELAGIKAVLSKSCFCDFQYDPEKDVAPTGTISGEKISDTTWEILIDVVFYGDEHKNITGSFRLKK